VHAFSQQTPSLQKPLSHWSAAVQAEPSGPLATQMPPGPMHVRPGAQVMVWQQRPSTQNPVTHWLPSVQVAPLAPRGRQVSCAQYAVLTHSALVAQLVPHTVPRQR
jgi:hypothetical protein